MTDGAQQCSVLKVISGDIDGIALTRAARGSGVGSFRSFRFHKERFTTVHLLLHTHYYLDKKHTLVIHFCE